MSIFSFQEDIYDAHVADFLNIEIEKNKIKHNLPLSENIRLLFASLVTPGVEMLDRFKKKKIEKHKIFDFLFHKFNSILKF